MSNSWLHTKFYNCKTKQKILHGCKQLFSSECDNRWCRSIYCDSQSAIFFSDLEYIIVMNNKMNALWLVFFNFVSAIFWTQVIFPFTSTFIVSDQKEPIWFSSVCLSFIFVQAHYFALLSNSTTSILRFKSILGSDLKRKKKGSIVNFHILCHMSVIYIIFFRLWVTLGTSTYRTNSSTCHTTSLDLRHI